MIIQQEIKITKHPSPLPECCIRSWAEQCFVQHPIQTPQDMSHVVNISILCQGELILVV